VRLLNSPSGFYGDIIEMLKRARRRILISTLYIGVEETELVCLISSEPERGERAD
jgi:CDP-diacylglycerol--glycerol-3-phosphate 3-phosphatidyltransferase